MFDWSSQFYLDYDSFSTSYNSADNQLYSLFAQAMCYDRLLHSFYILLRKSVTISVSYYFYSLMRSLYDILSLLRSQEDFLYYSVIQRMLYYFYQIFCFNSAYDSSSLLFIDNRSSFCLFYISKYYFIFRSLLTNSFFKLSIHFYFSSSSQIYFLDILSASQLSFLTISWLLFNRSITSIITASFSITMSRNSRIYLSF